MAEISTTQAFSDGDTVTATKLNNITGNASIGSEAITNRSAETTVDQANDLLLMYDASATALKKVAVSNVIKAGTASNFPVTGNTTIGGTLGVTGASTLSSTLGVSDTISATKASGTGLAVTSNATVGGTLGVTGNTTLTGTLGIQAGTAASPAIAPSSDTNTGIFFPAADTVAASTNGTEAVRIDSSGNCGIGTTSPSAKLHVVKSVSQTDIDNADQAIQIINSASDTSGNLTGIRFRQDNVTNAAQGYIGLSSTGNSSTRSNLIIASPNTSGNSTERLRIDSSGNVGIGTTSPATKLSCVGSGFSGGISIKGADGTASSNAGAFLYANASSTSASRYAQLVLDANGGDVSGGDYVIFGQDGTGTAFINNYGAYPLYFGTSGSERLRIDSSGRVGVGTASPLKELQINATEPTIRLEENSAGSKRLELSVNNAAEAKIFANQSGGTLILGTVGTERLRITSGGEVYIAGTTDQGAYNLQVNGTGVWGAGAYVNGSDERLKENIHDITSGLDVVEKLRPVSFQYKEDYTADRSVQSGFIAQDLLVALEGKNYLEGVVSQGPTYYNVAYQNLIPILAKAIQELKAENDSLKSRIEALEAA